MSAPSPESYFDHNATTATDPRVVDVMLPWFTERHGNPSSAHRLGRAARDAVENARRQVAELLGAESRDVVFTASGTEANNGVIETAAARGESRGRLLLTSLEHPSITAAAARAQARGLEITTLAPDARGQIAAPVVEAALTADTRLACAMLAHNELGTLQDVAGISAACRARGVPVLCDAVQAIGKIPVNVERLGVSYLSLGGHKFYGPPGIAALWVEPGAPLDPWLVGGPQEGGRRASTENVPAIVGLGEAARLAHLELEDRRRHLRDLRDRFEAGLETLFPKGLGARVLCQKSERLPNTSLVLFGGISGQELTLWLDARGIAVSTGSACHAGTPQPSATLLGMGVEPAEALGAIRFSFGITNDRSQVDRLLGLLEEAIQPRGSGILQNR
ncbi:MAG: cysteine desulfurase family protein [Acidobacteriota bacterium]